MIILPPMLPPRFDKNKVYNMDFGDMTWKDWLRALSIPVLIFGIAGLVIWTLL